MEQNSTNTILIVVVIVIVLIGGFFLWSNSTKTPMEDQKDGINIDITPGNAPSNPSGGTTN